MKLPSFYQNTPVRLIAAMFILSGCAGPGAHIQKPPDNKIVSHNPVRSVPFQNFVPKTFPQLPASLYHTVRPKETLWRISKLYDVPVKTIMAANGIQDSTKIQVGQTLYIPGVREIRPSIPLFRNTGQWQYLVVHHTATRDGDARSIHRLHLKRGWKNGLGYHFVIDNGTRGRRDGEIEIGRRWYKQMSGAHANQANMNKIGIGVALIGNFSETHVSEEQLQSLAYLVRTLQRHYGIPTRNVLAHQNVPGARTECPGTHFPWKRFKRMLN